MEYRLEGPLLLISGRLDQILDMSFDLETTDLLNSKADTVTIDMTEVSYIASNYLGRFAALAKSADSRGKKLVVCVADNIAEAFQNLGLGELMEINAC